VPKLPPSPRHALGIHFSEAAGLRHLHVGGSAIQSAMRLEAPDELALAYTRAMMGALLFQPHPRDVLIVGLGGGSLAKFVYREFPKAQIVAIEIDLRVVRAAVQLFHLPIGRRRLCVLVADGAQHVSQHPQSADLILLDAFVNHRQAPSVRTESFYRCAWHALKPDGVLAINFMSDDPGLRAYVRRLTTAFGAATVCMRAIGEDNIIVFAFRDDPGIVTPRSLVGRAIALQRKHGLEFRAFAARLRPLHRVYVNRRPLLSRSELRSLILARSAPAPGHPSGSRSRSQPESSSGRAMSRAARARRAPMRPRRRQRRD
jgi:spermidine synthase